MFPKRFRAALIAIALGSIFTFIEFAVGSDPVADGPSKASPAIGDPPYAGSPIPTEVPIVHYTIKLLGGPTSNLDRGSPFHHVGVVEVGKRAFLFPAFVAGSPTVAATRDGLATPLFRADGRVALLDLRTGEVFVLVDLLDVFRSSLADDIREAVMRRLDDPVGRQATWPDIPDLLEVQLRAKDPANQGRPRIIASYTLDRSLGAQVHRTTFRVQGENLELFRKATRDDLSIEVLQPYRCQFSLTDFTVSARFVETNSGKILDHLFASPDGSTPVLVASVGGTSSLKSTIDAALRRSVLLIVDQNRDADVDVALVERLVFEGLRLGVTESMALSSLRDDTLVKMILSGGISLSAPVGKLTQIIDYVKADQEKRTNDILETLSQRSKDISGKTGGSVDICGMFGASGILEGSYADSNED
jgi:hypothetical protein